MNRRDFQKFMFTSAALLPSGRIFAAEGEAEPSKFKPDWVSLKKHQVPE
jgi:hypothetical protein